MDTRQGATNPNVPGDGKRVQFEFSADAFERLQTLKRHTDAGSYAEVIRNAMRLYEWFIKQQGQGYQIGLIKDGEVKKQIEFCF